MNLDVYITSCPQSRVRERMAALVLEWWRENGFHVELLKPMGCHDADIREHEYRRWVLDRHILCHSKAKSPIYIVSDDDVLPLCGWPPVAPERVIREAAETMCSHPDFAMLAATLDNEDVHRWTPEGYQIYEDKDVLENQSAGGLRLVRKDAMNKFPKFNGRDCDAPMANLLRENGWRVGYLKNLRVTHIGKEASEVWTWPMMEERDGVFHRSS